MTTEEALRKTKTLKKRNFELEKIIIESPLHSFEYAKDVLKAPFFEGEKIISSGSLYSLLYAEEVLFAPFYLGHPVIFKSIWENDYINFLKSINYDLNEISEWLL